MNFRYEVLVVVFILLHVLTACHRCDCNGDERIYPAFYSHERAWFPSIPDGSVITFKERGGAEMEVSFSASEPDTFTVWKCGAFSPCCICPEKYEIWRNFNYQCPDSGWGLFGEIRKARYPEEKFVKGFTLLYDDQYHELAFAAKLDSLEISGHILYEVYIDTLPDPSGIVFFFAQSHGLVRYAQDSLVWDRMW